MVLDHGSSRASKKESSAEPYTFAHQHSFNLAAELEWRPRSRPLKATRHMPKWFSGQSGGYTEFIFEVEAVHEHLGTSGDGKRLLCRRGHERGRSEISRSHLLERAVAERCIGIALDHRHHGCGWHARSPSQAELRAGLRAWHDLNRWYRPKSAVEGASSISMARITEPPRSEPVA